MSDNNWLLFYLYVYEDAYLRWRILAGEGEQHNQT